MTTKMQNIKSWIKDHNEEIAVGAVVTAFTAAFVGCCYWAVKQDAAIAATNAARVEHYISTVNEILGSGNQIFHLADGTLLSVASDTAAQIHQV